MSSTTINIEEGSIFGLGHPLLDYVLEVPEEFVKKFHLELNGATRFEQVTSEMRDHLFHDIHRQFGNSIKYLAGGSVQNSLRGVQWMLGQKHPKVCVFMGCVGDDKDGRILTEKAIESNFTPTYMISRDDPTGVCVVLVSGGGVNRSLVARLGAANKLKTYFLVNNWSIVEKAKILYASGFHCTTSPDQIMMLAEHSAKFPEKKFVMNISATFIPSAKKVNGINFMDLLPFVNILFGNDQEYRALATAQNLANGLSLSEIGQKIAEQPKKSDKETTIIITQGEKEVIVVTRTTNGPALVRMFGNQELPSDQVVDTNGAGDAFVGGYLSQLIKGQSMETCIAAATYAAHSVIRLSGAQYPPEMDFHPV